MSKGMSCQHVEMLTKQTNKQKTYPFSKAHFISSTCTEHTQNMDIFIKDKQ